MQIDCFVYLRVIRLLYNISKFCILHLQDIVPELHLLQNSYPHTDLDPGQVYTFDTMLGINGIRETSSKCP